MHEGDEMKELTPHPQAEILRAIADGKTVQMRSRLRPTTWHDEPTPFEYLSDDLFEWRVKPETIAINGHAEALLSFTRSDK